MFLATAEQIRKADQIMIEQIGFPGYILMETAGRKSAETMLQQFPGIQTVTILCGPGNNGGDGLVIARYMHLAGIQTRIVCSHPLEKYTGDALTALRALNGSGIPIQVWPQVDVAVCLKSDLLVDALLGTGFKGELRGPIAEILDAFRSFPGLIAAVDLPSGLDADTGAVHAVPLKAALTTTFQLPKVCQYVYPAAEFCGAVAVLDIGIWGHVMAGLGIERQVTDTTWISAHEQSRPSQGHKGTFGHILTIAGSANFAGAAALASHAVLKMGAGLSTAFSPEICREAIHALGPEVMLQAWPEPLTQDDVLAALRGKDAVAVGPGLGQSEQSLNVLGWAMELSAVPMVLDADALNLLAANPGLWERVPAQTVLTPHPGEMKRLLPDSDPILHRLQAAEELARQRNVVVVLKGAGTIIASPDGRTNINPTGNVGMGTGGTGDVLTGMIAALLPRYPAFEAACIAVYLHGLAGDLAAAEFGQAGMTAGDLLRLVPKAHLSVQSQTA